MVSRRILLVGGDPALSGILRDYFHIIGNCEVESAEYCDDALTTLRHRPFDLVLVLGLKAAWRRFSSFGDSVESGILFLKEMRALSNSPPAIVISGSTYSNAKEAAFANGAFAFLSKPLILRELDDACARAIAPAPRG